MENLTQVGKEIDGVYKNLLSTFHPTTRELVNAAKAYLKALHGSTAAFSLYIQALKKCSSSISKYNGEKGRSFDATTTEKLEQQHAKQLAFLKSFYVDFVLPIENNLERDVGVVQSHHRRHTHTRSTHLLNYKKASSTLKKLKKKKIYSSHGNLEKEIVTMQNYQEESVKVEQFFKQSLEEVVAMEGRRFGFVFERVRGVHEESGGEEDEDDHTVVSNEEEEEEEEDRRSVVSSVVQPPPIQPPPPPPPPPLPPTNEEKNKARALYSHKNNDEDDGFHQLLGFEEGDMLLLGGPPSPYGWQFGENLKTKKSGWFPTSFITMETTPPQEQIYSKPFKKMEPEIDYEEEEIFEENRPSFHGSFTSFGNYPLTTPPPLIKSSSTISMEMKKNKFFSLVKRLSFSKKKKWEGSGGEEEEEESEEGLPWKREEFGFSLNVGRLVGGGEGNIVGGSRARSRGRWEELWGEQFGGAVVGRA